MGCIIYSVYNRRRRVHLDTTNTRFAFSCPLTGSRLSILDDNSISVHRDLCRKCMEKQMLRYLVAIKRTQVVTYLSRYLGK